ncbi:hypothetical protein TW83_04545 [Paracoccus sp. S4493]|nr:hypothetical protein TW83_04545 [Paracoccus sp. S4493]
MRCRWWSRTSIDRRRGIHQLRVLCDVQCLCRHGALQTLCKAGDDLRCLGDRIQAGPDHSPFQFDECVRICLDRAVAWGHVR